VQADVRTAGGRGAGQRVVDHAAHGRGVHHRKCIRHGAGDLSLHLHLRAVEVGDSRVGLHLQVRQSLHLAAHALHLHAVALEYELAGELAQRRPGLRSMLHGPRHVGVIDVGDRRGDQEFATLVVGKREPLQVTTHAELHAGRAAGLHRCMHVLARRLGHPQRQVAPDAGAVGATERALQLQAAGQAPRARLLARIAGAPARLHLALGIRIAEARLVHAHGDLVPFELPLHVRVQLVHGQHRLVEHAGEFQRTLRDGDVRLATRLRDVEVERRTPHTGNSCMAVRPGTGRQLQANGATVGLVLQRRFERALPVRLHALDQTPWRIGLQCRMRGRPQRQA
jgi:hypothetical protein